MLKKCVNLHEIWIQIATIGVKTLTTQPQLSLPFVVYNSACNLPQSGARGERGVRAVGVAFTRWLQWNYERTERFSSNREDTFAYVSYVKILIIAPLKELVKSNDMSLRQLVNTLLAFSSGTTGSVIPSLVLKFSFRTSDVIPSLVQSFTSGTVITSLIASVTPIITTCFPSFQNCNSVWMASSLLLKAWS